MMKEEEIIWFESRRESQRESEGEEYPRHSRRRCVQHFLYINGRETERWDCWANVVPKPCIQRPRRWVFVEETLLCVRTLHLSSSSHSHRHQLGWGDINVVTKPCIQRPRRWAFLQETFLSVHFICFGAAIAIGTHQLGQSDIDQVVYNENFKYGLTLMYILDDFIIHIRAKFQCM